jgi:hypothetical protein
MNNIAFLYSHRGPGGGGGGRFIQRQKRRGGVSVGATLLSGNTAKRESACERERAREARGHKRFLVYSSGV